MFWKGYKSKKQLRKEISELRIALEKEEKTNIENYLNKNMFINTDGSLSVDFKGKELVKIFAGSFWELVSESDNYIICDLYHEEKGVEVTIKKKGKLSPQDKLKKVEILLSKLLSECEHESDTTLEAYDYLNREKELRKKYAKQERGLLSNLS